MTTLNTVLYQDYESGLPQEGQHILCQEKGENMIVYQAFNPGIAHFAIENQRFGGKHYKFTRMSWIKPNFLWMMYRAGWALKEHQQRILAIEIRKEHFIQVLEQAVHSSFKEHIYGTREAWKVAMAHSEVRLQWDPDHYPSGEKHTRRAIQLGLKGDILRKFCTDWIISIEDITDFSHEQKRHFDSGNHETFTVVKETVLKVDSKPIREKLELNEFPSIC